MKARRGNTWAAGRGEGGAPRSLTAVSRARRGSSTHSSRASRPRLLCLLLTTYCLLSGAQASAAWSPQNSGTLAWLRAVFFLDERRGWAVGSRGIVLTTDDGGEHWQQARRPTEDAIRDVFFLDVRTGWLVCERSVYKLQAEDEPRAYLLKTGDGGRTWSRVKAAGKDIDTVLTRVVFADAERGWALGELGALYATQDGGATWSRQQVPTRHLLLGASFLDANAGWLAGAGNTILQTQDGGETWRLSGTPISAVTRFSAVAFADERRGWAVGSRGIVLATANGGRTWEPQETNVRADLSDVKFLDAREGFAVGAEGTIIHTVDGGKTWRTEASGTRHTLERLSLVSRTRGWAVGFGGTIVAYSATAAPPPRLKK